MKAKGIYKNGEQIEFDGFWVSDEDWVSTSLISETEENPLIVVRLPCPDGGFIDIPARSKHVTKRKRIDEDRN